MADVFISFIHEEERVAGAVQDVLRQILNKEVFISADEWLVYAGEIWLDRIKAELAQAKAVVLMLSEESVKRPWINFEAGAAWLAGKPVIPACFRGLSRNALPKPYSSIQAVDLPNGLYYLVRSVSHHVEPTALLPAPF